MNRIGLAFRAFWRVVTDLDFAARVEPLFSKAPTGPDLRVLAVLQRDGRLVDFLEEEIDGYSDAQIGAAVRDIHRGCRKSLRDYLTIAPVIEAAEEERVTIPADFDPAAIRLVGNVTGAPPFAGGPQASWLAGQLGAPSRCCRSPATILRCSARPR